MMLEKLSRNNNVEKLRIIMLFKANFNHNNKWLGCATMRVDKQHTCLPQNNMVAGNTKLPVLNV